MKSQKQFKYHKKGKQPSVTTRSRVLPDRRAEHCSDPGSRLWRGLGLPNPSLNLSEPLGLITEETEREDMLEDKKEKSCRMKPWSVNNNKTMARKCTEGGRTQRQLWRRVTPNPGIASA